MPHCCPLSGPGSAEPFWLSAAIAAQAASLLAYALLVHQLLAERAFVARTRKLVRATVGGIALGASLPGGQALSTAYWYKLLRREGAPRAEAVTRAQARRSRAAPVRRRDGAGGHPHESGRRLREEKGG